MVVAIVITFFILVGWLDFAKIVQGRDHPEIVFYAVCFCISFIVLLLTAFKIILPDPVMCFMEFAKSMAWIE